MFNHAVDLTETMKLLLKKIVTQLLQQNLLHKKQQLEWKRRKSKS